VKTLLAGVVVALVVVSTAAAEPPPAQMIGKWTRTVAPKDIVRAGSSKIIPGQTWTLVVTQRGSTASVGGSKPMKGQIVPSSATQINIELGVQKPDLYGWRRYGKTLVLHKVVDSVPDRVAVLNGVWKKRS
jgi:hypothetical protein